MRLVKIRMLFFLLLLSTIVQGQQEVQITQYMYNMNILNPAYAGFQNTLSLGLLGRTQWTGIEGAPRLLTFSAHSPVGKRLGLGFSVIADEIGPLKEQYVYADVSYTIPVSYDSHLSFGLKAGSTFIQGDLTKLVLNEGSDPTFSENLNKAMLNFGLGLFYYNDKFYAGISMPNILESLHLKKRGNVIKGITKDMHYFGTLGYVFDVSETLKIKPSLLAKVHIGAPLSLDISTNFLINKKFELGVSWRKEDALIGLLNVRATPSIRIGYAYDYTLSDIGDYSSGSHELFLLYNIDRSGRGVSPRFF